MIIVRYADDFIVGFEHEADARRFLDAMRERLEEFALSLHPEKTRLIEFGRFAADSRERRGLGKPETFNFLGFTFICGKSRRGKFLIKRKTRRDRMRAKLQDDQRGTAAAHASADPRTGEVAGQVVTGYFNYHAVPTNSRALGRSATMSPTSGGARSRDAARRTNDVGADEEARRRLAPSAAHPAPLAQCALRRHSPKVGAVCGKAARTDLMAWTGRAPSALRLKKSGSSIHALPRTEAPSAAA